MKDLHKPLHSLSENVHKHSFDIVFAPVKKLIKQVSKLFAKDKESQQKLISETLLAREKLSKPNFALGNDYVNQNMQNV
jgi:hypothetical protein